MASCMLFSQQRWFFLWQSVQTRNLNFPPLFFILVKWKQIYIPLFGKHRSRYAAKLMNFVRKYLNMIFTLGKTYMMQCMSYQQNQINSFFKPHVNDTVTGKYQVFLSLVWKEFKMRYLHETLEFFLLVYENLKGLHTVGHIYQLSIWDFCLLISATV